ncbi:MAG: hypothetical protein Kow006_09900 [Gammaproteobacteria bacterium]
MKFLRNLGGKLILAGATGILIAGCGGGGGGGTAAGTTLTQGVITNFGSVWVNGTRYHTNSASVLYDDNPGSESDLAVGMVVTIVSTSNSDGTATASSVSYDDELKGPIEAGSIDLVNQRMTVLGQVVDTSKAIFDDSSHTLQGLSDLSAGEVVEISGFPSAATGIDIEARRVERKAADVDSFLAATGKIEVKGHVDSVDGGAQTLTINGLTVDWSSADIGDMPVNPASWDSLFVEAKCEGLSAADCFSGNTLLATKVEPEQEGLSGNADSVEIEGPITEFNGQDDFKVAGQRVDASGAQFMRGSASDLANGREIEVKGSLSGGVLQASLVKFEQEDNVRVEGEIEAINGNVVTVMGIEFTLSSGTEMRDDSSASIRRFSVSDLAIGDAVEIRGFLSGGVISASRLEREDNLDADRFIVQAPPGEVDNITDPAFRLLGMVTVDTSALGFNDFQDENDSPIGRASFFARLASNSPTYERVKARGTYSGGTLNANEVEFEND